jgi:outer membrane protein TolC
MPRSEEWFLRRRFQAAAAVVSTWICFAGGCLPIAGFSSLLQLRPCSDDAVNSGPSEPPSSTDRVRQAGALESGHLASAQALSSKIEMPGEPLASPRPASPIANPAPSTPPVNADIETLPIDLPTALRLVDSANPTIALARERVREALFRQRQMEILWIPNLQSGPSYIRHDGLLQNSSGLVFPVSKWNFFIGGGTVMSFQVADALFLPLIARQQTQAEAAHSRAVTDSVQLDVALTYLDLAGIHARLTVNAEVLAYAEEMLRFALVGREATLGKTPADTTRARTEVELRRVERIDLEGQAADTSARLAQLLLLRPTVDLRPADPALVPITLVPTDGPLDDLLATGLLNRPELAESRALVAAALAYWRQAKVAPFVPRIDFMYSAGEFGGGIHDDTERFSSRGDGQAQAIWELHNLGAGDVARARERRSRYNQATLHVTEVQAQVAAEIAAAAKRVRTRERAVANAQNAVRQAEETWTRLYGGAFGMNIRERRYDPLEPLLAVQQVAAARSQYVQEIVEYNKAQFRLYTAMGQPPLEALPGATALPLEVSPTPPVPKFGQPLQLKPREMPK